MPPRLNKRQQRELEDLQALGSGPQPESSEAEEEATPEPRKAVASAFSALMAPADANESAEEEEEPEEAPTKTSKNKKKKKKKPALSSKVPREQDIASDLSSTQPTISTDPVQAKKDKKARQKAKKAAEAADDGQDEVDRALAELSLKYTKQDGNSPAHITPMSSSARSLANLLAVQPQHLDAAAELRRFFGSKVVSSASASSGTPNSKGGGRRPPQASVRPVIARPKPEWWPGRAREGLSLRALTNEEITAMHERHQWDIAGAEGERWWKVEYSRKYRAITREFMRTVMSGDPEGFWRLIQNLVYHADTLLQLSEGYRYREEHSTATDFVERAIFAYERAFVGSFNFMAGVNRLDFDSAEDRPFFLALHRMVIDLQRRGCFRTAFEHARLLFSLDPNTDPHGALLHFDFLAPKLGMGEWLLDVWDVHTQRLPETKQKWKGRVNVTALPGWAYARALIMRTQEDIKKEKDHAKSTAALRDAILHFPTVVPVLADKADITLPDGSRSHAAFRIHTDASAFSKDSECVLHLLSHLYAQRSSSLWKASGLGTWFSSTVSAALPSLPSSATSTSSLFVDLFDSSPTLAHSVYRHTVLQDPAYQPLLQFIPRAAAARTRFAGDPLSPTTATSAYDDGTLLAGEDGDTSLRPSRREEQRMLARMVPDANARAALVGLYDSRPELQQRYPNGVLEFVQAAAQMDEEVLQVMMFEMMEAQGREGAAAGQMPGGMPQEWEVNFDAVPAGAAEGQNMADDADADDWEDSDEEQDPENGAGPVRMLRNVLNRFWGGPAAADEPDSEDDDGTTGGAHQ